eukprot:scaffold300458_cov76-Cyclotella_meneghiniana.AAC.3
MLFDVPDCNAMLPLGMEDSLRSFDVVDVMMWVLECGRPAGRGRRGEEAGEKRLDPLFEFPKPTFDQKILDKASAIRTTPYTVNNNTMAKRKRLFIGDNVEIACPRNELTTQPLLKSTRSNETFERSLITVKKTVSPNRHHYSWEKQASEDEAAPETVTELTKPMIKK